MKKVFFVLIVLTGGVLLSCGSSQGTTKVLKPRYHNILPTKRWRIDIPIGARHIRLLERKRTQIVKMR